MAEDICFSVRVGIFNSSVLMYRTGSASLFQIQQFLFCVPSIMLLFRSPRRQHTLWRVLIVWTGILSLHRSLSTAWLFSSQVISASNGTARTSNAAPHQDWYADLMHLPPDGTSRRKMEYEISTVPTDSSCPCTCLDFQFPGRVRNGSTVWNRVLYYILLFQSRSHGRMKLTPPSMLPL
jgi:hypothetical protein